MRRWVCTKEDTGQICNCSMSTGQPPRKMRGSRNFSTHHHHHHHHHHHRCHGPPRHRTTRMSDDDTYSSDANGLCSNSLFLKMRCKFLPKSGGQSLNPLRPPTAHRTQTSSQKSHKHTHVHIFPYTPTPWIWVYLSAHISTDIYMH